MIEKYIKKFKIEGVLSTTFIPSKKNSVYLVKTKDKLYILKIYKLFGKRGFYRENFILKKDSDILIPRVINTYKKEALLEEYIEGQRLYDLNIEKFTPSLINKLTKWFYSFHRQLPGYVRGDSIPQNFILKNGGEIVGIDFEEAKRGDINIDIAEFAAFILAWKKIPQEKRLNIAHTFLIIWGEKTGYDLTPIYNIYLPKFFRKFYFFRKDSYLLELANTNWEKAFESSTFRYSSRSYQTLYL